MLAESINLRAHFEEFTARENKKNDLISVSDF